MKAPFVFLALLCLAGCGPAVIEHLPQKGETPAAAASDKPQAAADEKKAEPKSAEPEPKPGQKEPTEAEEGKEKKEAEAPAHVTVHCVPAQKRAVAVTVDGLGRTESLPEGLGAVTAAVEGHVHRVLANPGDTVRAGQPIVELDTTVVRTVLAEKTSSRDSMQAALAFLVSPPRPEECKAAELAIEQAKVTIDRDKALVERLRPLLARQEVSAQQVFDAEQALKQAVLQRQTTEAQLKLLKLGPRSEAIAEAQTKIAIAEQGIANTKATLDLHTLRAPIGGMLDSVTCHPGQTLTVGTAIGEVVDTRRIFVTVYFPMRSAQHLRAGLSARIDVPSTSDLPADKNGAEGAYAKQDALVGRVAFIGRVADPQTGSFPARVLVDNAGGRLRLGQLVKATVTLRTEDAAIAVPEAAIFDQGEGPLVAVVRDGKIKLLHPEVGSAEGGFVLVTKTDLRDGEPVAVEGAYSVPEGTVATVAAAAPPALVGNRGERE